MQRVAWSHLRAGFHLQNISVDTLAHIYENTLVDEEIRRHLSIHSTPPEIAQYIVNRLPFDSLSPEQRRVFEPFAGHAVFLVASLARLRDLLGPNVTSTDRHHYFLEMLSGLEKEPFAIEVARLSLMLADYPHPNGWQLRRGDVYTSPNLNEDLSTAQIVLCNPPYEDFSPKERLQYTGLQSTNKAVEILTRVLAKPPALLGFVLPRVFVDGRGYRGLRQRLVELYGHVEIVALPDVAFVHSQADTVLLSAHGLHNGPTHLRTALIRKADYTNFLTTGQPMLEADNAPSGLVLTDNVRLWLDPLQHVWDALQGLPRLDNVAEIHRGIEYRQKFSDHKDELISSIPRRGFSPGLSSVSAGFEPYVVRDHVYVCMAPDLMRGNAYRLPWDQPKVIVNAARTSRGPWRVIAAPDRSGLVCYQRFHGIWPRNGYDVEVLSAVLNSPIANAFLSAREPGRDNRKNLLAGIPIPELSKEDSVTITDLVVKYRQVREAIDRPGHRQSDVDLCNTLLRELDEQIVQAYRLPQQLEYSIDRYFSGYPRPGPDEWYYMTPHRIVEVAPPRLPMFESVVIDASINDVAEAYSLTNAGDIEAYLKKSPPLLSLLLEVRDVIRTYFPDAQLSLELEDDPEIAHDERLVVSIFSEGPVGDALARLEQFDDEWWLDRMSTVADTLSITLAFK